MRPAQPAAKDVRTSECVCVSSNWALSQLAGGSTHLETQLGWDSRNCKHASAQRACITQKSYFSTCFIKHMQTHTGTHPDNMHTLAWQTVFARASHLNFHLKCHTHTHTRSLSLYWSALELHGNTSLWQHCNLGGMSTSNERQPTHKHTDRVTVNVCNLEFCWDQNQGFFHNIPRTLQNTPGQ